MECSMSQGFRGWGLTLQHRLEGEVFQAAWQWGLCQEGLQRRRDGGVCPQCFADEHWDAWHGLQALTQQISGIIPYHSSRIGWIIPKWPSDAQDGRLVSGLPLLCWEPAGRALSKLGRWHALEKHGRIWMKMRDTFKFVDRMVNMNFNHAILIY